MEVSYLYGSFSIKYEIFDQVWAHSVDVLAKKWAISNFGVVRRYKPKFSIISVESDLLASSRIERKGIAN